MSFKSVNIMKMKTLQFHPICLELPSLSYPLKYHTVNAMKLNQKIFLKRFHKFTPNGFRIVIKWETRNIRSLFPLKSKNDHKLCIMYKGGYSCGSRYIGETKRNAEVRWNEHDIIIQLKVQNHHNAFEAISTTVLQMLQMLQKMLRQGRT